MASKPCRDWKRQALLVKWLALTLALPMYFTELLTHGLENKVVLLGFELV